MARGLDASHSDLIGDPCKPRQRQQLEAGTVRDCLSFDLLVFVGSVNVNGAS